MKKLLVVLLALTCLSALAFADGVTVGMDFGRSQFVVASNSGLSGADTMEGWTGPTGTFPTGQRLDAQFAWSSDHAAVNLTGYLGPTNLGNTMEFVNAYGTLKLVPDMFKMIIGRIAGDGFDAFRWDSAHPIHDVDNNSVGRFAGWGVIFDVAPKDSGFEAAMMMKTADPFSTGAVLPLAQQVTNWDVGASYTVPNLIKVQAGSQTMGTATTPYVSQMSQRNIFAGVQVLAVPNLTLFDSFYYRGFDVQPTAITAYSDELALQYVMGPLTIVFAGFYQAGLTGNSLTSATANVGAGYPPVVVKALQLLDKASVFILYPEIYYNMGMVTLGLYAGYENDSYNGISNNGSVIDVEPYIKLNDFGLRVSLHYQSITPSGSTQATGSWEIPIIVDWGF